MSYEFYKILHLAGLFMLISGLVGLLATKMAQVEIGKNIKSLVFISHGLGSFFVLLSGFGLLARLNLAREMPQWAYVKIVIWLLFGVSIALVKRKGQWGWPLYLGLMGLFIIAAFTAVTKPF